MIYMTYMLPADLPSFIQMYFIKPRLWGVKTNLLWEIKLKMDRGLQSPLKYYTSNIFVLTTEVKGKHKFLLLASIDLSKLKI